MHLTRLVRRAGRATLSGAEREMQMENITNLHFIERHERTLAPVGGKAETLRERKIRKFSRDLRDIGDLQLVADLTNAPNLIALGRRGCGCMRAMDVGPLPKPDTWVRPYDGVTHIRTPFF